MGKKMFSEKKLVKQLNTLKKNSVTVRLAAEGWDAEWKILIAVLMSAQSRDEVTIIIANELFNMFPSLEKLANANYYYSVLKIFKSLNYNKTKAKHVIACANMILTEFNGVVPKNFDDLVKLPGVGRKTANVFLAQLGNANIGVDTHVAHISNRLGWSKSSRPEKIELELQDLFPKKYWNSLNYILVSFGKTHTSRKKQNQILDKIKLIE